MGEDKFRFSKCPYCKRHGIPAFGKFGHKSNPHLFCIHCNKKFVAKLWASTLIKLLIVLGASSFFFFLEAQGVPKAISACFLVILLLVPYFIAEYFAPLREVIKPFTATKTIHKKHKKRR